VTREEAAEREATRAVVGAHAQRRFEGARPLGRSAGALEALRGLTCFASRGEGLPSFEVRIEPREELPRVLAKASRGEIAGRTQACLARQIDDHEIERLGDERFVFAERREERGAARIAGEQGLTRGADEIARLFEAT